MSDHNDPAIVPLLVEAVTVDKIDVVTDAVSLKTSVETTEVVIDEVVIRETLSVRRVQKNEPVMAAPPPREDGNTTIISLVEERPFVEMRLFVVEEIHVTRERKQERVSVPITLRTMHATVTRPSAMPHQGIDND